MKNMSVKKIVAMIVGAAAVLAVAAVAAVLALRVDSAEAQQIALDTVGGGEIVSQEVSSEGLWNEYSYEIINGDTWYDIEISGFGSVTELESVSASIPGAEPTAALAPGGRLLYNGRVNCGPGAACTGGITL